MRNTGYIVGILIAAFALAIGFPLLLIWSLNTLVPALAIPYTLETWFAAFLIPAIFKTELTFGKSK
jgi:hypothetical protein